MPPLVTDTSESSTDSDMPDLVQSSDESSDESSNESSDESSNESSDESSNEDSTESQDENSDIYPKMSCIMFRDVDCPRCKSAIHTILHHDHNDDMDDYPPRQEGVPSIIVLMFVLLVVLHLLNLVTTYCSVSPLR